MQNKCPKCKSKLPIKGFLTPVVAMGYNNIDNNIDNNIYVCDECNTYIEWTINRKIAIVLSYIFFLLFILIGSNIVQSLWLLKVLLPGIIISEAILLLFPNQTKARIEHENTSL